MSIKSLIQSLILLLIISIIVGVYLKYFDTNKDIVEEVSLSKQNELDKLLELEKKISELELKNKELNEKIEKREISKNIAEDNKLNGKEIKIKETKKDKKVIKKDIKKDIKKKEKPKEDKIKNLVKDVKYTSVDEKGNKFYLLATSGKSNIENNDILDLENVRGKIVSDLRDTIFIVSDFAQYNSVNLNSKFYKNVIINYQDKQITCENFNINMETNKAIAYNNVVITDPKSIMTAGIVEFDLKTKNININPKNNNSEIEVITK